MKFYMIQNIGMHLVDGKQEKEVYTSDVFESKAIAANEYFKSCAALAESMSGGTAEHRDDDDIVFINKPNYFMTTDSEKSWYEMWQLSEVESRFEIGQTVYHFNCYGIESGEIERVKCDKSGGLAYQLKGHGDFIYGVSKLFANATEMQDYISSLVKRGILPD